MKLGPFKELVAQGRPRPHGSSDPPPILMVTGHWTGTMAAETESGHEKNTEFMGCSEEREGKNYQSVIITRHDDMDQFSS